MEDDPLTPELKIKNKQPAIEKYNSVGENRAEENQQGEIRRRKSKLYRHLSKRANEILSSEETAMNPTNNPTSSGTNGTIAGQGADMQPATPAPRSHAEEMELLNAKTEYVKEKAQAEKDQAQAEIQKAATKAFLESVARKQKARHQKTIRNTDILEHMGEERSKAITARQHAEDEDRKARERAEEKDRKEREETRKHLIEQHQIEEAEENQDLEKLRSLLTPAKAPPAAPVAHTPVVGTVGSTAASTVSEMTQENNGTMDPTVVHTISEGTAASTAAASALTQQSTPLNLTQTTTSNPGTVVDPVAGQLKAAPAAKPKDPPVPSHATKPAVAAPSDPSQQGVGSPMDTSDMTPSVPGQATGMPTGSHFPPPVNAGPKLSQLPKDPPKFWKKERIWTTNNSGQIVTGTAIRQGKYEDSNQGTWTYDVKLDEPIGSRCTKPEEKLAAFPLPCFDHEEKVIVEVSRDENSPAIRVEGIIKGYSIAKGTMKYSVAIPSQQNKEIDIDPSSSRILLYNDFMRFWVPDAHSSVVQGDKFPTDLNEEMHYRHVDDTCREQTCKVQDLTLYTANKFEKDDNVRAQDQNGVLFDCRIAEFSYKAGQWMYTIEYNGAKYPNVLERKIFFPVGASVYLGIQGKEIRQVMGHVPKGGIFKYQFMEKTKKKDGTHDTFLVDPSGVLRPPKFHTDELVGIHPVLSKHHDNLQGIFKVCRQSFKGEWVYELQMQSSGGNLDCKIPEGALFHVSRPNKFDGPHVLIRENNTVYPGFIKSVQPVLVESSLDFEYSVLLPNGKIVSISESGDPKRKLLLWNDDAREYLPGENVFLLCQKWVEAEIQEKVSQGESLSYKVKSTSGEILEGVTKGKLRKKFDNANPRSRIANNQDDEFSPGQSVFVFALTWVDAEIKRIEGTSFQDSNPSYYHVKDIETDDTFRAEPSQIRKRFKVGDKVRCFVDNGVNVSKIEVGDGATVASITLGANGLQLGMAVTTIEHKLQIPFHGTNWVDHWPRD